MAVSGKGNNSMVDLLGVVTDDEYKAEVRRLLIANNYADDVLDEVVKQMYWYRDNFITATNAELLALFGTIQPIMFVAHAVNCSAAYLMFHEDTPRGRFAREMFEQAMTLPEDVRDNKPGIWRKVAAYMEAMDRAGIDFSKAKPVMVSDEVMQAYIERGNEGRPLS